MTNEYVKALNIHFLLTDFNLLDIMIPVVQGNHKKKKNAEKPTALPNEQPIPIKADKV